jgi:hypothetical protein
MDHRRGRVAALAALALAAGCTAPTTSSASRTETNSATAADTELPATARGGARAEVPEIVAPVPGSSVSATRPTSWAYVSETNRIVFFDHASRQLAPDVRLSAVPHEIAVVGQNLILGFATGDLAVVDGETRQQTARISLDSLRARAVGGDVILDEVRALPDGDILVAGRLADPETAAYRSFIQERRLVDLALKREELLSPKLGVIQDVAIDAAGSITLLLSDGGLYDLRTRKLLDAEADTAAQLLRYGHDSERWIGNGGVRPGLLTPSGAFVPLAAGRVTDIIPLTQHTAAALTSQPPQVWVVARTGEVLSKIDVDDYPYAGALVGESLQVGSVNGDALQILNWRTGRVEHRLRLGQGIVRLGAFP